MSPRVLAILMVFSAALPAPGLAGDTTYSETRSIPREPAPRSSTDGASSEGGSWDLWQSGSGDEGEARPRFRRSRGRGPAACLEEPSYSSPGAILMHPVFVGLCYGLYGLGISHVHLFAGDAEMDAFRSPSWRFGLGFGLGALWMPHAAGGPPASFNAEALHVLSPTHQVGLRAMYRSGVVVPIRDYARTVLVDGIPIGDEIDRFLEYSLRTVPLLMEYHRTGSAGLSLTLGAGAAWVSEEAVFRRSWSWRDGEERREAARTAWRPAFSAAVGRYSSRDGRVGRRFAIRYQAELLRPDRRSSLPGDNTGMAHSLTWDWSWLL